MEYADRNGEAGLEMAIDGEPLVGTTIGLLEQVKFLLLMGAGDDGAFEFTDEDDTDA